VILLLMFAIHWWAVAPHEVATTTHTHVEVTGRVSYVSYEGDGDVHLRICDTQACVVAEIIPAIPITEHPRPGDTVTVRGISRIDPLHKWPEVHPVMELITQRRQ
jgi:hypothetical protein